MCDIRILSDNELFRLAIETLLKECVYIRVRNCAATLLISDGSTLLSAGYQYNHPICGIIVFIENPGHENLMKYVNSPFRLHFINNKSSLNYIKAVLMDAYFSISKMKHCLAHINSPPDKWLTPKEFAIISDVFKGMNDQDVSVKYNITYKTTQNYRKSALNKLKLKSNFNTNNQINYFFDFIEVMTTYQTYLAKKVIKGECPASLHYRQQPVIFYS